ncbi:hypothetical protein TTHERM_00709710 (macronuclear) [Tetrahymena thermophila SB210]|uniref:Uncharacterized protein n=1 Tax=Tetrahymena thermophila (strain SB210) TaxID=312017 RepID=I7M786_TETTS|nr:hypothetical protein TTHERM_00709710 [Tetrahymena thermophila SB210]EAR90759.2 hypothetical protein TTHERM_00709710 [Tetrahymena thermophila SB210]|eukprot:XP_001011004.2 hypothetical protein TTHERM_00709710 [Tetrahymena thermophila SB210]
MFSENIQILDNQNSMKSKNQFSKASSELIQKLQQLNLSSSSSDSFDSEFKQPFLNALKLNQQLDVDKPNFKQNNFFSEKSNESNDLIIQKQIIERIIQNQLRNSFKEATLQANKENFQQNNFQNAQSDSERSEIYLFQDGKDQFRRISQRLKTSPSLQKKLVDKNLEDEEDPFKIYDKLKENINKEITLSKQRNEQYLNEINHLQNELMSLKLQEVEFEKDFLLGRHQNFENKIFTFNTMPNNNELQSNQKLSDAIQSNNLNHLYKQPQSFINLHHSIPKFQQLQNNNNNDQNISMNYKIPYQYRSFSTLDNSNKFDRYEKRHQNKSLQLFHNQNQNNSILNYTNQNNSIQNYTNQNNSIQNYINQNDNNYDYDNILYNQRQQNFPKNSQFKEPLNYNNEKIVLVNYPNSNIIQQEQLQQTKQNYQFVSLLQNSSQPDTQSINVLQKCNDQQLDISQENEVQYDYFKPIYNSGYQHNQSELQKEISTQEKQKAQKKRVMSIKPLQLQSQKTLKQKTIQKQDGQVDFYKSPLQNIRIKEQEQISDQNKVSKVQKKLNKLVNPAIHQSKSEASIKKKAHSLKSLEYSHSYKDQKQNIINSTNESHQSPKKNKSQNIKELKQNKKMKSLYEQTQSKNISQISTKKKDVTSSNNLQLKKMNSLQHLKVQSNLSSKQDLKKKEACKECLNLLRKNISTTYCTQKHNQKNASQ